MPAFRLSHVLDMVEYLRVCVRKASILDGKQNSWCHLLIVSILEIVKVSVIMFPSDPVP